MRIRRVNDEVLYSEDLLVTLQRGDIDDLKRRAESNARKRIRVCAHRGTEDALHEMFIIHGKNAYVRPHKHLGKPESLYVIEGTADVVIFDEEGNVRDAIPMGGYASGRPFYYRLDRPDYHTLLIDSEHLVFHETTGGPFRRADTVFAPWSPEDGDTEAVGRFLEHVRAASEKFHG